MPASGTFGSGQEYSEFIDLNQLGAVVTKGVSYYPWEGNPPPRIMETASGMINAVGLQNPGIDVKKRDFSVANKTGVLSGAAIKPIALRMVYQVYKAVQIPIIGMGGVSTTEDALEFIMAGATGVAIGTANFNNPYVMLEVIEGLNNYMGENGIEDLKEIRGIVD